MARLCRILTGFFYLTILGQSVAGYAGTPNFNLSQDRGLLETVRFERYAANPYLSQMELVATVSQSTTSAENPAELCLMIKPREGEFVVFAWPAWNLIDGFSFSIRHESDNTPTPIGKHNTVAWPELLMDPFNYTVVSKSNLYGRCFLLVPDYHYKKGGQYILQGRYSSPLKSGLIEDQLTGTNERLRDNLYLDRHGDLFSKPLEIMVTLMD